MPQVNVWVGPFFVISGYVAAYTATELGKYAASPRVAPAWAYSVARVAGYYPLFILVQLLFAPMFAFADNAYNGPIATAAHALMGVTLTQVHNATLCMPQAAGRCTRKHLQLTCTCWAFSSIIDNQFVKPCSRCFMRRPGSQPMQRSGTPPHGSCQPLPSPCWCCHMCCQPLLPCARRDSNSCWWVSCIFHSLSPWPCARQSCAL